MRTHSSAHGIRLGLTLLLLGCAALAHAADNGARGFCERVHKDKDGKEAKYFVFIPHAYKGDQAYPLILFLHGGGESGTDGKLPLRAYLGPAIKKQEATFPFIVVFPQSQKGTWNADSEDGQRTMAILAEVKKELRVDKRRLIVAGGSMGGAGTWSFAMKHPDTWSAMVPICGSGDVKQADKIKHIPCWCFHGALDKGVSVEGSRRMIAALRAAGGTPKYTEYPEAGHDIGNMVWGTRELFAWLLEQKRADRPADGKQRGAGAAEAPVPAAELKASVAKALPPLTKGAAGHREERTCFACHSQGLPVMAMTTARQRGVAIDSEELKGQLQHIADFLGGNRTGYLEGKGQGGQADTAGYALVALERGGWKADETTAAVTQYLLLRNADLDHWRANSPRPPSEGGNFTTTYVALRGLAAFRTADQQKPFEKRREQVRQWLVRTPTKDHEDRVFRLLGLKLALAANSDVEAAVKELTGKQRDDGGWAQLDGGEPVTATKSDAYATGTALVALHQAGGLNPGDPAYQRGLRYLLKTQQPDGTWHVVTRSKPIQKYFETGFPYGKDQFISSAATGWAATALALAIEPVDSRPRSAGTPAGPRPDADRQ
jgi:predicted esterase